MILLCLTSSDDEICSELVLFMLAGHDTTSITLSYALWALGHHPDIQEQVYAEVAALGNRPLNPGDVPSLARTIRVLHEALRLCPPAAGVPRLVNEDLAVDGYRLEAGTVALVSFSTMHRDPELWDDPLAFDPDRFLPERARGRSRWQYLPFGGGPRSCVGDHFAMLEATLALATIVRDVEIHSIDDDFPLETPFTVVAAAPIRARVHTGAQAPLTEMTNKENEMKYLVSWTYRLNGSAVENEESLRRGLAVFAKWTPPASTTYHQFVGRSDGGGGFAMVETDNPSDLSDVTSKFAFVADYQIYPVVDIDKSAQALQEGVEFRDSIQ